MARIEKSGGIKKTDLKNIKLMENVRKTYEEIEERARSIESKGQLSPIILQPSKEETGKFILIAGYCRFKAHEFLVKEGQPYNNIEYVVKTGDPLTIQITENIQRSNLKSVEIENALKKMIDRGDKQQDIVLMLNKSKSWVSDVLTAEKIRSKIKIDTSVITSSALKHLRNIPEKTINTIIPEIKASGGTVAAVKQALLKIEESKKPITGQAEKPELKKDIKPNKDNKKVDSGQDSVPVTQDPFNALFNQIDKLIDSGHDSALIMNKISNYLEVLK